MIRPTPRATRTDTLFHYKSLFRAKRIPAKDCKGRAISAAEAAEVRKRRQEYIHKVLAKAPHSDVEGKRLERVGFGFFVAEDGSVLTSHHVVDGCSRSEEHTSELQSLMRISYAVFCLKKKSYN